MKLGPGAKWSKYPTHAFLLAILLSALLSPKAARSQGPLPVSYTFEECEQVAEASLRDELNRITQAVFAEEQGGMDVVAIVERNWVALNLDVTVDAAVDTAIEQVREEMGPIDIILSGWSPRKAEELATAVANKAFGSPEFRAGVDQLSAETAADVVSEIRRITAQSASSALLCVQAFIGEKFSQTMVSVLEKQIQDKLDEIVVDPDTDRNFIAILKQHAGLGGGVAVILGTQIGTQIAKRLAQVVARNIVGKVVVRILGRAVISVIPVVGWIVGGVLIVLDIYNAREGALPYIRDSLQGEEVKTEIRSWTAQEVSAELRTELPELARDVANSTFSQWQDFRRDFTRVLDLAKANPLFKSILDNTEVDQVAKLAKWVALVEEKEPGQLDVLIRSGQFEFILALPDEALEIFRVTEDLETLIAWAEIAGDLIGQVFDMEVYRVASPSEFMERTELERVLALGDAATIQKLMLLERDEREVLLGLSSTHTGQIIDALSAEALSKLVRAYLAELEPRETNVLVDAILSEPGLMSELDSELVRQTLLESPNLQAALEYLAQGQTFASIMSVFSGDVPWTLFWHKFATTLGNPRNLLYVLALLIILYLSLRLLIRRRQPEVNVTVNVPESRGRKEESS